jgi:hypothetical protein
MTLLKSPLDPAELSDRRKFPLIGSAQLPKGARIFRLRLGMTVD